MTRFRRPLTDGSMAYCIRKQLELGAATCEELAQELGMSIKDVSTKLSWLRADKFWKVRVCGWQPNPRSPKHRQAVYEISEARSVKRPPRKVYVRRKPAIIRSVFDLGTVEQMQQN